MHSAEGLCVMELLNVSPYVQLYIPLRLASLLMIAHSHFLEVPLGLNSLGSYLQIS